MGKPLPGIETRIVDGELQLRAASSPTFFSRYLDGERFEGEWWPTGDLVRDDDDGYLFFEGRDDDIILSSGYRIGPIEVESALLSHPAVAEAAAVAAPDPERGAVVRAIVVLRDGASRSRASWPASCRSTASARPPPTSSPASSSSPTSCRRPAAARSSGPQLRGGLSACGERLGGVDRPAEVVALGHVDAVLAQHLRVSVVLDELGDRRACRARGRSGRSPCTVSWSASLRGMSRMKAPSILIRSKGSCFR